MLYGTTFNGTSGTVFQISTNGTGFTNIYSFTGGADGNGPWGGLVVAGDSLYGTTYLGGASGYGTIFNLSLPTAPPPQLGIARAGSNVLVTWSTNATGFVLQSTANLVPAIWTNIATNPPVVNGQYTFTNAISGARKFYRLAQ
jgi:uncharacterized repeat protein (TIGR03803 family)